MTIQYSANPQAMGNVRAGRASFHKGSRNPEDVLRDHKAWNRGAAAEIHFRNGYWEAAAAAGMPRHDQLVATSLVDPCTAPRPTHCNYCNKATQAINGLCEFCDGEK